ncbi:MAG: hypothetical protein R6U84_06065 [Candidatus Cloacimonadales bacterium]
MRNFGLIFAWLFTTVSLFGLSLQQAYHQAEGNAEYEKIVYLETGVTYTGGLYLGKTFDPLTNSYWGEDPGDVRIAGNGAILDLQGGELVISYTSDRLDLENLIIINGNVRYRGVNNDTYSAMPIGSVRYCTFYQPQDYAIRLYGCGSGILLERNLAVDAIETGDDFMFINGKAMDFLPTGINYAISGQIGFYGMAELRDNWSYHSEQSGNADLLQHFGFF